MRVNGYYASNFISHRMKLDIFITINKLFNYQMVSGAKYVFMSFDGISHRCEIGAK